MPENGNSNQNRSRESASDDLAPAHLSMQEIGAKSYQYYLNQIKKGSSTGISGLFGSSIDLLCGPAEPIPEKIDVSGIELTDQQLQEMSVAHKVATARICRQYLQGFVEQCKNGELEGRKLKKPLLTALSEEDFLKAWKELTASMIFISAIEQIDPVTSPEWLRQFLWDSLTATDNLCAEPSVDVLLHVMCANSATETQKISQNMADQICKTLSLGLQEIGDPGWNALFNYLRNSKARRYELVRKVLIPQS
jgi:hypothetical protein